MCVSMPVWICACACGYAWACACTWVSEWVRECLPEWVGDSKGATDFMTCQSCEQEINNICKLLCLIMHVITYPEMTNKFHFGKYRKKYELQDKMKVYHHYYYNYLIQNNF